MTEEQQARPIAIYLIGYNAESLDRLDDPTADSDGHVITASVMRREDTRSPISPVNVRIGHGSSPRTVSAMLRKMADMVDKSPELVNALPGTAARRMPDGEVKTKRVTIEQFEAAVDHLPEDQREQLLSIMDRLREAIAEEDGEV